MGIYIWGTGCGASELLEKGFPLDAVTAFVDSFPSASEFLGIPVVLPGEIVAENCELLIITARHAQAIEQRALEIGIPREKLLFLKNAHLLQDRNAGSCAENVLPRPLLEAILPRQRIVPVPHSLISPAIPARDLENDYVRLATLELLCRRLHTVPGSCAELGVYRGFFSRCINQLLPERKLYLFDSFAGFSGDDGASAAFQAAHENTTVQKVLSIMPHPESVVVKPGFFPASLDGLEDRFCLVSLDVDFAKTTLEGLRYFWPRMSKGAYLLLHDWGEPRLPGVKDALETFQQELGKTLPAVPIPDLGGTLVLAK